MMVAVDCRLDNCLDKNNPYVNGRVVDIDMAVVKSADFTATVFAAAGFALFELLVALAIFGILALSIIDFVNHDISSDDAADASRSLQSSMQTLTRMAVMENGATMTYVPSTHDDIMPYLEITSGTESIREKLPYHVKIQLNGVVFSCLSLSATGFPTTSVACKSIYFNPSSSSSPFSHGLYNWTFQSGSVGGKWTD
ncbi:prepilin-type N-terminal cleavage/methylation domain-containing protein [Acidithiobacillus ferrivorans]|nr:prepilin-type N-terminal cleavage/methylation domain-containing protein [Acidithiobacillus ferrivorans]